MGNSNSQQSIFQIILDNWEPYHFDKQIQIMRNMNDGRLAERKDIFLNVQNSYQNDADIYKLRKGNKLNLVQIYAIQKKFTNQKFSPLIMCQNKCTEIQSFQILTQFIIKRLDEMYFLNLNEFLYSLQKCLIGLKKINSLFGKVKITPKMIGINYKGQIKVWVNQNFSSNMPQSQAPDDEKGDEEVMISNLVELLQQRCKFNLQQIAEFKQQFQPNKKMFRTSIKLLENKTMQKKLKQESLPIEQINKKIVANQNLIKQTNFKIQQNPINQLTSSSKTFKSSSDWYFNSKHANEGNMKKNESNIVNISHNKQQKRSPYMKLNLLQSFAKTEPKSNEHNLLENRYPNQIYYNNNKQKSKAHPFQKFSSQNNHSFGSTAETFFNYPIFEEKNQNLRNNFPIYKRLSQSNQYRNKQY